MDKQVARLLAVKVKPSNDTNSMFAATVFNNLITLDAILIE